MSATALARLARGELVESTVADDRRGGREGMKMTQCGKCEGKGVMFADRHVSEDEEG